MKGEIKITEPQFLKRAHLITKIIKLYERIILAERKNYPFSPNLELQT